MAIVKPGPDIEDRPFQILCFGRYRPPKQEALTQWQKDVLAKVKKLGSRADAGRALGITTPKVHTILATIRKKGWETPKCKS